MWIAFGLLLPVVILGLIIAGVVALLRGRGEGKGVEFSTVVAAYAALVMLVSVFLTAAACGVLVKAGLASAAGRDFSYNTQTYTQFNPATRSNSTTIDPSDGELRDDIANGLSLAFFGVVLFVLHAIGAAILRRRSPRVSPVVTRGAVLLGLAAATLTFLIAGATALNDVVRRYVLSDVAGTTLPFEQRHPGEPLAFAIVMTPLVVWFGWRLWQEFAAPDEQPTELAAQVAVA